MGSQEFPPRKPDPPPIAEQDAKYIGKKLVAVGAKPEQSDGLRSSILVSPGSLGRVPAEVVGIIEQLLHDTMTFTSAEVLIRHKVTTRDRGNASTDFSPQHERCFGACYHATNLECDNLWLVMRVDENNVCVEVWYGYMDPLPEPPVGDPRPFGVPEPQYDTVLRP